MSEPARKQRKVELQDNVVVAVAAGEDAQEPEPQAPSSQGYGDEREGSPDIKDGNNACVFTGSPSPTRASPSPNLTPRPPQLVPDPLDPITRSRPPSLPRKEGEVSPIRVPYSIAADSMQFSPKKCSKIIKERQKRNTLL